MHCEMNERKPRAHLKKEVNVKTIEVIQNQLQTKSEILFAACASTMKNKKAKVKVKMR